MRYGQILSNQMVPQWRQCYIDYDTLKIFVILIKDIIDLVKRLQKQSKPKDKSKNKKDKNKKEKNKQSKKVIQIASELMVQQSNQAIMNREQSTLKHLSVVQPSISSKIQINNELSQNNEIELKILKLKQQLNRELKGFNKNFYNYLKFDLDLSQLFMHMKYIDLNQKFKYYKDLAQKYPFLKHPQIFYSRVYCQLIEYLYIQNTFLGRMFQIVREGQRKILKKHKKVSKDLITTPGKFYPKLNRLDQTTKDLEGQIQDYYINFTLESSKESRIYLRTISDQKQYHHVDSFVFGLGVGAGLAILAFLIGILTEKNFVIGNQQTPQGKAFNWDFIVWRGLAFFFFYWWILGFNIYAFETYHINHRLIFKYNEHHYSTSRDIFKTVGLFTAIYLLAFLVYIVQFTGVVEWSSGFPSYYLMLGVWVVFIIYLFAPLPIFNHKGRIYAAKVVFWAAFAPCLGVVFPVIWGTDQLISLANPFSDLVYTFCYYTNLESIKYIQPIQNRYNPCVAQTRSITVLVVGAVAYSYRIMQCLRQGYDAPQYFNTRPFYNTIKYLLSLITVFMSYVYKLNNDLLALWVVFAAITTLYSFVWDIKVDWGLFQNDHPYHKFLRKDLFYPVQLYYVLIIVNFIFRLAWILSLSPDITAIFGSSQIFALVTGMIQIARRGFWNLLRTQVEQVANLGKFKALPDVKQLQNKLIQQCQQFIKTNPQMGDQQSNTKINFSYQNRMNLNQLKNVKKQFIELIENKIDQKRRKQVKAQQIKKSKIQEIQQLHQKLQRLISLKKGQKPTGGKVSPLK